MCMTLYLASTSKLPFIELDRKFPSFYTKELDQSEQNVRTHFSMENVLYVGSDQGCGCGFRHAIIDGNEWLAVTEEDDSSQDNHTKLVEYISSNIKQGIVEISSCWNGEVDKLPINREEIKLEELNNENFHFKERGLYRIEI